MSRAALTIRAILRRVGGALGFPWFAKAEPQQLESAAPTARDLWRAARIEHIEAVKRGDTRAVGRARQKARRWAHADLAGAK